MRAVRERMGLTNVELLLPFVRTVEEARRVLEIMEEQGLSRKTGLKARRETSSRAVEQQQRVVAKRSLIAFAFPVCSTACGCFTTGSPCVRRSALPSYSSFCPPAEQVYIMCEIPSNALLADEFLDVCDGFSIGSNDLCQLTLGACLLSNSVRCLSTDYHTLPPAHMLATTLLPLLR